MEAEIQLQLKNFPDSNFSFLFRSWLTPEKASSHQKLTPIPMDKCLMVSGRKKLFLKLAFSFFRLDYCGIALLIVGSFVPWLYYSFYCRQSPQIIYLVLIIVLGIISIVVSMWDKFGEPKFRTLRAGQHLIIFSIEHFLLFRFTIFKYLIIFLCDTITLILISVDFNCNLGWAPILVSVYNRSSWSLESTLIIWYTRQITHCKIFQTWFFFNKESELCFSALVNNEEVYKFCPKYFMTLFEC